MLPKTLLLAATCVAIPSASLSQTSQRETYQYFRQEIGLTDAEIEDIDNGVAVSKILETGEKPEVVVFGAVYIRAPIDSFLKMQRDVESLMETENYIAVGRFSDPPQLSDVARMKFTEDDVKDLQNCKPGSCNLQLPTSAMETFQSEVKWSAEDPGLQVNRMLRRGALQLIENYKKGGNKELGVYMDKNYPVAVAETFEVILSRVKGLAETVPEVRDYLRDYPHAKLHDTEEYFYWEEVKFGLKPTLRVNHVVIHNVRNLGEEFYIIANKQLYASHYFQTAIDVWVCDEGAGNPRGKGFYLVTVKGSRQHGLTGLKGGIMRAVVVPRTRDSMRRGLDAIKRRLEEQ